MRKQRRSRAAAQQRSSDYKTLGFSVSQLWRATQTETETETSTETPTSLAWWVVAAAAAAWWGPCEWSCSMNRDVATLARQMGSGWYVWKQCKLATDPVTDWERLHCISSSIPHNIMKSSAVAITFWSNQNYVINHSLIINFVRLKRKT